MSWAEVFKTNNDFANTSLDTLIHLQDYKMFGESSYVFRNKELLHGLYELTYLSMNDLDLCGEALEYHVKGNKNVGSTFAAVFGIEKKELLETLTTMKAVTESNAAMQAIAKSDTAMKAILASNMAIQEVVKSSTALTAIFANSAATQALLTNSTAMKIVAESFKAMQMISTIPTALKAMAENNIAMKVIANSTAALKVIVESSKGLTAIVASSTALAALSLSQFRKSVLSREKAVGLILPMALGGNVLFSAIDDSNKYSRIEYQDGTLHPFADQNFIDTHTGWGDLLRVKPKAAKLVRVYNNPTNFKNRIDIILISGSITAA